MFACYGPIILLKFNKLSIYYQNVRGLRTKTHEFYRNLLTVNFDIIVLTETWLNSNVFSSELFDERYVIYRRDRNRSGSCLGREGGGVLVAVAKRLSSKRMVHWESDCEDLWVKLTLNNANTMDLVLCSVYIPPPVQKAKLEYFIDNCNKITEQCNSPMCIIGDFNLSHLNWSNIRNPQYLSSVPSLYVPFVDFVNVNNFMQCNNWPNVMGRTLDLVLTNISSCEVIEATERLCPIDPLHPPLEIELSFKNQLKLCYNEHVDRPNFYKADYEALNNYFGELNWKLLFSGHNDVNEITRIFYDTINIAINRFVPPSKTKSKRYPPWFSHNLIKRLREKNKLRIRYKKYGNPLDKIAYRLLTDRCHKIASSCYKKYMERVEDQVHNNPKFFWSYIKGKRGGLSSYPATITNGITAAADGNTVCNLFAEYFSTMFLNKRSADDDDGLEDYWNSFKALNDCMSLLTIDQETIYKKLKSLDEAKGAGSDGIPPVFIIRCAQSLVIPLHIIFNLSFQEGVFPKIWKVAKVVPIFKGGDNQLVSNYRPISILPVLAKVLESLVCPVIQSYFQKYLSISQHGFTKGRSTSTNLTFYTESIIEQLDARNQIDAIYTDFSKAFDRVNHDLLAKKLYIYGISGALLKWFKSYLEGRSFTVVVNGFTSILHNVTSGVPQGSHLGPILFNIFVNDLPSFLQHSSAIMFADDLKLSKCVTSDADVALLQSDLDLLAKWCNINGMELNTTKCSHIKFTRKINPIPSTYNIEGVTLNEVEVVKDLGILLDRKLTFATHTEYVISRVSKLLGFIIRNGRSFKRPQTKISLYNSLVRSIIEYGSVVWRPHYATHTLRIERIQKRFARHLAYSMGIPCKRTAYVAMLERFKMVSLEKRMDLTDLTFFYKVLRNLLDCPQLVEKFKFRVPSRVPRKPLQPISRPFRRTVHGSNSPISRMGRLYNQISGSVDVHSLSLAQFKWRAKELLGSV